MAGWGVLTSRRTIAGPLLGTSPGITGPLPATSPGIAGAATGAAPGAASSMKSVGTWVGVGLGIG